MTANSESWCGSCTYKSYCSLSLCCMFCILSWSCEITLWLPNEDTATRASDTRAAVTEDPNCRLKLFSNVCCGLLALKKDVLYAPLFLFGNWHMPDRATQPRISVCLDSLSWTAESAKWRQHRWFEWPTLTRIACLTSVTTSLTNSEADHLRPLPYQRCTFTHDRSAYDRHMWKGL